MEISCDEALDKIKEILLAEEETELYLEVVAVIRRHFEKKNAGLNKKTIELQKKVKLQESIFFDHNAYWVREGDKKDGPFCYCCWHETGTLIQMKPCEDAGWSECVRCKSREQTGKLP